jgi:hypothetical protein
MDSATMLAIKHYSRLAIEYLPSEFIHNFNMWQTVSPSILFVALSMVIFTVNLN